MINDKLKLALETGLILFSVSVRPWKREAGKAQK